MNHHPDHDVALHLEHLIKFSGLSLDDVMFVRHTYQVDGIYSADSATLDDVLEYTSRQGAGRSKIPANPPRFWFIFLAEAGRRCRLYTVLENLGEDINRRTEEHRFFDLRPTEVFRNMRERLLIEWTRDSINWAKFGKHAHQLSVLEIAPRSVKEFPGYDNFVLNYQQLQRVTSSDPSYVKWRAALEAVQGIYLITDTVSGEQYVGKADGSERILGRWSSYARNGHGGNVAMRQLRMDDPQYATRYQFSLLRVFGPHVPQQEVEQAENHFKRALLTRKFGLNRN